MCVENKWFKPYIPVDQQDICKFFITLSRSSKTDITAKFKWLFVRWSINLFRNFSDFSIPLKLSVAHLNKRNRCYEYIVEKYF